MRRLFERLRARPREEGPDREEELRLATAVLLVEMSQADFEEQEEEAETIRRLLAQRFDLDRAATESLADEARVEVERAVSLHDYTRILNEALGEDEKRRVIEMLWEVALAADLLDKHEDYLMRKLAELLYVPHSELIRLKHIVQERLGR